MTQANNQLAAQNPQPVRRELTPVADESPFANLLDTNRFNHMFRVATMFSDSTIIPEHYRKNVGNCFIAVQMAIRLGVDPFMFMQKTYVVHGKPGMEAQLAIALINTSGLFVDSLDYQIEGGDDPFAEKYRVRAFATRRSTGKVVYGPWVDWSMVRKEKWDAKDGSKWKTMPGMMFLYRSATFFGRAHCAERLMGMSTVDEVEDIAVAATVARLEGEVKVNDKYAQARAIASQEETSPASGAPATSVATEVSSASAKPVTTAPTGGAETTTAPAQSASTTPATGSRQTRGSGRPKAQAAPTPEAEEAPADVEADQAHDQADAPAHEETAADAQAAKKDETYQNMAHAFASERPIVDLKNYLMGIKPQQVRFDAMKEAGVSTIVDAPEEKVRDVAFAAKVAQLRAEKA